MARSFGSPQRIALTLLPALLLLAIAGRPTYPQSSASTQVKPDPKATAGSQTSEPPPGADQSSQLSSAISPAAERQAEIEADTKKLYQLSAELRAEVARTYKESLSLTVLKKAEDIERLAKSLKVLMSTKAASANR